MSEVPLVLAEIASVAGWESAWALVRAKGGQEIFVPRHPGPRHWLSQIVGHAAAQQISAYYRDNHTSRLLIPMASALQRDKRFAEAIGAGHTVHETAAEIGVHKRTVYRHRARLKRANDRQGNLF